MSSDRVGAYQADYSPLTEEQIAANLPRSQLTDEEVAEIVEAIKTGDHAELPPIGDSRRKPKIDAATQRAIRDTIKRCASIAENLHLEILLWRVF